MVIKIGHLILLKRIKNGKISKRQIEILTNIVTHLEKIQKNKKQDSLHIIVLHTIIVIK